LRALDFLDQVDGSVIIAVIAMRKMQSSIYDVTRVIAMWQCFMSAIRAMDVIGIVTLISVFWCAAVGVRLADFDLVLIHVVFVHVMEMPIVQIINMTIMSNGDVAASWAMHVIVSCVVRVFALGHHSLRNWQRISFCWVPILRQDAVSAREACALE